MCLCVSLPFCVCGRADYVCSGGCDEMTRGEGDGGVGGGEVRVRSVMCGCLCVCVLYLGQRSQEMVTMIYVSCGDSRTPTDANTPPPNSPGDGARSTVHVGWRSRQLGVFRDPKGRLDVRVGVTREGSERATCETRRYHGCHVLLQVPGHTTRSVGRHSLFSLLQSIYIYIHTQYPLLARSDALFLLILVLRAVPPRT